MDIHNLFHVFLWAQSPATCVQSHNGSHNLVKMLFFYFNKNSTVPILFFHI